MTCGNCLLALPDGARFCPACGTAVAPDTPSATPASSYSKFAEKAASKGREALKTDFGRSATDIAHDAADVAQSAFKAATKTRIGKYAVAGAVLAIPVPVIGPVVGALIGGAIGVLRSEKKS